jgi:hypothetical protein
VHRIPTDSAPLGPYRAEEKHHEKLGDYHALLGREGELLRERQTLRTAIAELGVHASLPILAKVRLATPCNMKWEDMKGDEHVRFCAECKKHVYELSNIGRAEAEKIIAEHEGQLCGQVWQRADGTILAGDCSVGRVSRRNTAIKAFAACASVAAVAIAIPISYPAMFPPVMEPNGPYGFDRNISGASAMVAMATRATPCAAQCDAPPPERLGHGPQIQHLRGKIVPEHYRTTRR